MNNVLIADQLNPIIKWPGGKSAELEIIREHIPTYQRYFEPFFGGGALYFSELPERSVINDACKELMNLYRFLKGVYDTSSFKREVYKYVDNWEKVVFYVDLFKGNLINVYAAYKRGKLSSTNLEIKIKSIIGAKTKAFNGLFSKDFCIDRENLARQITQNLISKIKRIKKIEVERGDISVTDLGNNIETAFRSGFYMHFRDIENITRYKESVSLAKKIANYYFIREFCYGAMFRYNKNGNFNIPYGGVAYNRKNFRNKVDNMFDERLVSLLKKTKIYSADFEEVMEGQDLCEDDFVFLDPPYDTDFSTYNNSAFGRDDHTRLANLIKNTQAKCMLVIKETPYILSLYQDSPDVEIEIFEKQYLYNIKGRNERGVNHLIIKNYRI